MIQLRDSNKHTRNKQNTQNTQKYLKIPKNTVKYPKIPKINIPKILYLHTITVKVNMLSPSLWSLPKFQCPSISESKVFPCFQCVSSDPKSHNIRHFWKRLWILTRALGQTNAGVNFRILTKMFYQNICLICSLLQHLYRPKWTAPSRNPNGLLHPEVLYMNTSSLRIS